MTATERGACPPGRRPETVAEYRRHLRTGKVREVALWLCRTDGTQRRVLASATHDADEAPGLVRIVLLDAAERRRHDDALLEQRLAAGQALRAWALDSGGLRRRRARS